MKGPTFFVLGTTHHQAPLEVRERLAVASEDALRTDVTALGGPEELAVLSTCNRLEFYGVGTDGCAQAVKAAFCGRQQFSPADFDRISFQLTGRDAALHLFEVASGLDSQMLGENEIFGQVKEAYAAAQARGSAGAVLNRIFQKAFQAAKHVRTHTAISSGKVSVANVAVDLAVTIFGGVDSARVLVLGTGEIGENTAGAFRSRGAADLTVAGRRGGRAEELAAGLGARALDFEDLHRRVGEFDVVVCSTAAPRAVLTEGQVASAMKRRPARPLLIVDLALPRDVEPSVSRLQNVFLYNLDDLAKIADRNRAAREAEAARCRQILALRADALWADMEARILAAAARGVAAGPGHGTAGQTAS